MTQLFPPSSNIWMRFGVLGGVILLAAAIWLLNVLLRSPYATRADVVRDQPVPFSHKHHVDGVGLDCRYCHTSVEDSSFAGLPSTEVCMTCHSQLFTDSPMLEPVRASLRNETPIEWTRVNDLPDFVYFDHSIHIQRGVACVTCHGRVDQMPLLWRASPFHMQWCLECHRTPLEDLRPASAVFDPAQWDEQTNADPSESRVPTAGIETEGGKLSNCSICHR